jgi:zinc resistance-associated protein
MFKPVVVATAALAIVGSSIVYAQQRFGAPNGQGDPGRRFEQRHWLSAEDMAAFADARIAALKAGLQLTPDQAKNWPSFEQALREMAQLRIERAQARQAAAQQGQTSASPATPFDRLAKRADNLSKVGAALKHIADAGAPLYQSLTDAQKHRFHILARMLRPHHHHTFARNEGRGQGFGPDGQGRGWHGYGPRRFGMEDNAPDAPGQNLTESEGQEQGQDQDQGQVQEGSSL